MPLHVVSVGIGVFVGAVIVQSLVWNLYRIDRPIQILGILFFLLPTIGFVALTIWGILSPIESTTALIFHLLMASAYVQSYPALQEDIPSFRILLLIRESGGGPVAERIITDRLADTSLFVNKIEDLVDEGLVVRKENQWVLTRAGRLLVRFFSAYRRWLGLEAGSG